MPNAQPLLPNQQHAVLSALERKAMAKGAGTTAEVCKLLGCSRSSFYAWRRGSSPLPQAKAARMMRKLGVALPRKAALPTPPFVDVAWSVFRIMKLLRPDVFLQYAENPAGVWVVSAAAGQWVAAITSGSLELNVNNKPVLCTEPDAPGCDELGRVLAKLSPRKQPQRKKALPDLRARFNIISKNGAR